MKINDKILQLLMIRFVGIIFLCFSVAACSSTRRADGWYPVSDLPENMIEGDAIVTSKDFAVVSLDTLSFPGVAFINGKLKPKKIQIFADATEKRIGKRIGFVFKDSVIMAPTVNCRIESGSFSINSPDKALIFEIYSTIDKMD